MGWHNYISNRHNLALIVNIQYYIFIPTYIVKTFVQNDYRVCCLFLDDDREMCPETIPQYQDFSIVNDLFKI